MKPLSKHDLGSELYALGDLSNSSTELANSLSPSSQFLAFFHGGIACFAKAGQLLVEALKQDPSIFSKILVDAPYLTEDALWCFHKIGQKQLRPEVMVCNRTLNERLLTLNYEQQSQLLDSSVEVVVDASIVGQPIVEHRSLKSLTAREAKILLGPGVIRTTEEQLKYLLDKQEAKRIAKLGPFAPIKPVVLAESEQPKVLKEVNGKKLKTLGTYRLVFKFGRPLCYPIQGPRIDAQRILLKEGDEGPEGIIELTEWTKI